MGANEAMMYPPRLSVLSWRMEIVLPFEDGVVAKIRSWQDLVSVREQSY